MRLAASGGLDHAVKLWFATPSPQPTFTGHDGAVSGVVTGVLLAATSPLLSMPRYATAPGAAKLPREPALLAWPLDDVAARLHLHPRTLQRQLRTAGVAYSDLRARCRQRLAEQGSAASRLEQGQAALELDRVDTRPRVGDRPIARRVVGFTRTPAALDAAIKAIAAEAVPPDSAKFPARAA